MTAPYYTDGLVTLHLGDCLDVMAAMETASIGAVVTDPPYGLEFMGGLVLDPFAGSGTTGQACALEGFRCVLIDQDPVAAELTRIRLAKPVQQQMTLDLPA